MNLIENLANPRRSTFYRLRRPSHSPPTRRVLAVAAAVFLLLTAAHPAELNIQAAASLTDALQALAPAYEQETGDKLHFNFAASSLLARQIEQGAPADLFFSADEAKLDELDKKNLLLAQTRRTLLSNQLVIIVPNGASFVPQSAADLTRPEVKRIALAEPETVPAGIYAREYLRKMGVWEKIRGKLVPTENVRAALAAVASGNVEAGMVYKSDALISKKVRVALAISSAEGPKILYPLAVLKSSHQVEQAKRFADYLSRETARGVFEKFGFVMARRDQ